MFSNSRILIQKSFQQVRNPLAKHRPTKRPARTQDDPGAAPGQVYALDTGVRRAFSSISRSVASSFFCSQAESTLAPVSMSTQTVRRLLMINVKTIYQLMKKQKSPAINPQSAEDFYSRGNLNAAEGDWDWAIRDYNIAIKLKSDFGKAYFHR